MKERKKHPLFWLIMVVLFVVAIGVWVWTKHGGPKINKFTGIKTTEYTSASDMLSECKEIKIPPLMNIVSDDVKCSKTGDTYQIVERSGRYLFRVTESNQYYFVIDSFELEDSKTDEKNTVENNPYNIRYVRYRNGCTNFENCTILNWDDSKYIYSIIIGEKKDKTEALELIGIKEEELREFITPHFGVENKDTPDNTDEEETTTQLETSTSKETSENIPSIPDTPSTPDTTPKLPDTSVTDFDDNAKNTSITFPKTSTDVIGISYPGAVIYSLGGKPIMAVVYDQNSNIFEGGNEIKIKNNMTVRYLSENPFNKETEKDLYNDYETIYNNMASIANSVEVKDKEE